MGVAAYTQDFNTVYAQMEENISCYNCHGNDAGNGGQITITHSYVNTALGKEMGSIDPATLACGQCHIEYYFTPSDKETMMPYSSIETMTPEAILDYYDSIGFYDWVQASTGTEMLKAQHPEMETFLLGKHANLLNCADCHMAVEMAYDGTVYHSHTLESPLKNEALLSTCATCHGDTDMVNKLSDLKDVLASAVSSGKMSEEKLDQVRKLHREAQWFFDFCYVENAEGAHNSDLAFRCLETADSKIDEAMAILKN
jgi:nitrite reductase (cytochrome c-552)